MTILWSNELARTVGDSGGARHGDGIGSCAPESSCGTGDSSSLSVAKSRESYPTVAGIAGTVLYSSEAVPVYPEDYWDKFFDVLIRQVNRIAARHIYEQCIGEREVEYEPDWRDLDGINDTKFERYNNQGVK